MSLIAGNLGVVQRMLDENAIVWGVCAGAAAHLYGNRRPIQDVDILVANGSLQSIVNLLKSAQKAVQFDGQRILWRGIKIFDDVTVRRAGAVYPFTLDEAMRTHLRRMPLLGAPVQVLAPEDILVQKLLLNRGAEQGKHDLADAAGIVRRQQLDQTYLADRIRLARAWPAIEPLMTELGVTLSVA